MSLQHGDKVQYINPQDPYKSEVKEGIVHAIKTNETVDKYGHSQVVGRTYLIIPAETPKDPDTGHYLITQDTPQIEMRIKQ